MVFYSFVVGRFMGVCVYVYIRYGCYVSLR